MDLTLQKKIDYFSELITCSHNLYYWCYDPDLHLLSTNCTEKSVYDNIFAISGCKEYLRTHLQMDAPQPNKPLILYDVIGLMWIASFEFSMQHITRIHMIGPAFIADVSMKTLEKHLHAGNYSVRLKNMFLKTLKMIPILSITTYFQYGQMLHFTITGQKIPLNHFHFQTSEPAIASDDPQSFIPSSSVQSHATWAAELELMRMVEEGNPDYEDALNKIAITGSTGQFNLGDPLREAQDYCLTFIILASRSAMRGGLSPEIAYTLSDFYIKSVETARSITDLQEISHGMYADYISRVREVKQNSNISKQILDSCNYIQIHSAEKLNIVDIAAHIGYTEYYFSRKFKNEVGVSVKEYIKQAKIERAKIMLTSGKQSILDISETLNFSSQSYFANIFRKHTGMTPAEYKSKNGASN